ncbi:hypothetical protein GWI33_011889, partial [Rhynchophorus ferrugineus]
MRASDAEGHRGVYHADYQRFVTLRYRSQAYLRRCESLDSWPQVLKNFLRRRWFGGDYFRLRK